MALGLFLSEERQEPNHGSGPGDPYGYKIFVGADDGKVCYYRVNSGGIDTPMVFTLDDDSVWTCSCDGAPSVRRCSPPVETHSRAVFVSYASGRVHCIDAWTGNRIWRSADLTGQGETLTAPAHGGASIYGGSSAGHVYGFNRYSTRAPLPARTTSGMPRRAGLS